MKSSYWNELLEQIQTDPLQQKVILAPSGMTAMMTQREGARRSDRGLSGVDANSYQTFFENLWKRTEPNREIEETELSTLVENHLRQKPELVSNLNHISYETETIPFHGLASTVASTLKDLYRHGFDRDDFAGLNKLSSTSSDSETINLVKQCGKHVNELLDNRNTILPSQLSGRLRQLEHEKLQQTITHEKIICLYRDEVYGNDWKLISELEQAGVEVVSLDREIDPTKNAGKANDQETNLDYIQNNLFVEDAPEGSWNNENDNSVTFYSMPDRDTEIETLVSHLINNALDEDNQLRFSDVAIVSPETADLLRFREALRRVDVPCFLAGGVSLLKTNVGKALKSYLKMFQDQFRRDSVMSFLNNPAVSLEPLQDTAKQTIEDLGITEEDLVEDGSLDGLISWTMSRSKWERYSRKAGIDRGIRSGDRETERVPEAPFEYPSPWINQLDAFENKSFRQRGKRYLKSTVEDEGFSPLSNVRRIVFSRCLRTFMKELEDVVSTGEAGEMIEQALDHFGSYIKQGENAPFGSVLDPDSRYHTTLWNRLEQSLRDTAEQVDWSGYNREEALRKLENGVDETLGIGDRLDGGGVFLGTPKAARGRTFEKLYFAGLNERSFPSVIREDPFLNDNQRKPHSDDPDKNIGPTSEDRKQQQKTVFRELIRSIRSKQSGDSERNTPELVLSYRRTSSEGGGSQQMPSCFFVSCYDLYDETAWSDMEEAIVGTEEQYVLTPVSIGGDSEQFSPITPAEAGLREINTRLKEHENHEGPISVPDLTGISKYSAFRRAIQNESAQFDSDHWGPESGCFEDEELGKKIADMYFGSESDRGVASPTRIGTFFECPRQFLFERVLNFEEDDDPPEEQNTPDNLVKGSIIHGVLEMIFRHFEEEHVYGTTTTSEELEELARSIFEKKKRDYENRKHTGLPFLWQKESEEYFEIIQRAINNYQETLWTPVKNEFSTYGGAGQLLDRFLDEYLSDRMEGDVVDRERTKEQLLVDIGRSAKNPDHDVGNPLEETMTIEDLRGEFVSWHEEYGEEYTPETVTLHEGEEHQITFGGRIDRIDERDGEPEKIRVLDYKTGKSKKYKENRILAVNEDNDKQTHQLQLPVYRMLAAENFPDRNVVESLYMFLDDGGDLKEIGMGSKEWEETLKPAFLKALRQMNKMLKAGEFPADYRCRYCPCDTICGTTSQRKAIMEDIKSIDDLEYREFREAATRTSSSEEDPEQ